MRRPVLICTVLVVGAAIAGSWAAASLAIDPTGFPAMIQAPFWLPALVWLGGAALLLGFGLRRTPVAAVPAPNPTWRAATPPPPALPSSLGHLLRPVAIVGTPILEKDSDGVWHARIAVTGRVGRLRVLVDLAPLADRPGLPVRTELARHRDVEPPTDLTIAVLQPHEGGWRVPGGDILDRGPVHRGRVIVMADERDPVSTYFVILPLAGCTAPVVVDESAFRFRDAWEAEAPLLQPPRWRGR